MCSKGQTEELEGTYSVRHLGFTELQSSLSELPLPWPNQVLLSDDLIALFSSDGPKWQSVIPIIGDLIKAAVA